MSAQPLISVIVPLYNVEAYCEKSIRSLMNQTYQNLEIIVVNDGSPDKSPEIVARLAKEDPRVKLFNKENGGRSDARNYGLDRAQGDYIAWLDSDDWAEANFIADLYNTIQDKNVDIAICGLILHDIKGKESPTNRLNDPEIILDRDQALIGLITELCINNYSCNKLVPRSFYDNIRFPLGQDFEDIAIWFRVINLADKIGFTGTYPIHYIMHGSNIVLSKISRSYYDYSLAEKEQLAFLRSKQNPLRQEYKKNIEVWLTKSILHNYIRIYNIRNTPDGEKYLQKQKELMLELGIRPLRARAFFFKKFAMSLKKRKIERWLSKYVFGFRVSKKFFPDGKVKRI